ncbi:hypothetical protein I7I48_05923 [Histoplasma ohiense]|nr:hypothetical protein I7I48_05923 [Histoplasma ohiense (nom. inval.)]
MRYISLSNDTPCSWGLLSNMTAGGIFFMEEMARLDYVRMGNELQPQCDGAVIVSWVQELQRVFTVTACLKNPKWTLRSKSAILQFANLSALNSTY